MKMNEQTIVIIESSKSADVRIRFTEWHGRNYCDIRKFVTTDAAGEREPTRKGIAIPIKLLGEVIEALHEAQRAAEASGFLKDEAA
jgi:hypothetical protein